MTLSVQVNVGPVDLVGLMKSAQRAWWGRSDSPTGIGGGLSDTPLPNFA